MIKQPGMSNAEYLRVLRDKAKADGLCTMCRARPQRPTTFHCEVCETRRKATAKRLRDEGRCKCGRDPRNSMAACPRCADRSSKNERLRKEADKINGVCTRCRLACAETSHTMCTVCLEGMRERAKRDRRERRAA